jgi:hypothetical protein
VIAPKLIIPQFFIQNKRKSKMIRLPHVLNRVPTEGYFWRGFVIELLFEESTQLWLYRFIYYSLSRKELPDLIWNEGFSSKQETMRFAESFVNRLADDLQD